MFSKILKAGPVGQEIPDTPIVAHKQTCEGCIWRRVGTMSCEAFPDGIPLPILLGDWDHNFHYESGEPYSEDWITDNWITFKPE